MSNNLISKRRTLYFNSLKLIKTLSRFKILIAIAVRKNMDLIKTLGIARFVLWRFVRNAG